MRGLIGDWRKYLREKEDVEFLDRIRRESFVNRPLGDEPFIKRLEKRLKCRLIRRKVGRPPKKERN